MIDLSAIVIPYNEEEKIEQCLKSVQWAKEIIVVDLGSNDNTLDICRRYTDTIVHHPWEPFVEPVRNFAVSLAQCSWVLLLDADEYVSPNLASAIARVVKENWPVDVVTVEYEHIRFGRVLTRSEARLAGATPRLFRKGMLDWPAKVHSLPSLADLRVAHLPRATAGVILHNTWPTVNDVIDRFQRYTAFEASDLRRAGTLYSTRKALTSTWRQFASIYVGQQTYKDGVPGLFYALSMAIYRLLVWMHLWEQQGRPQAYDAAATRGGRRLAVLMTIARSPPHSHPLPQARYLDHSRDATPPSNAPKGEPR